VTSDKATPLARATRKLYESSKYFRRSFRLSSESAERYVNLAVAFEIVLLDGGPAAARCNQDCRRKYWYLAMRRDKSIAEVALGRQLAVQLYWMWRNGCG
jgi:hypothetical protein